MFRSILLAGVAVAGSGLTGCTGTWDTLTSHRFLDHPFNTVQKMVSPEDPVLVLRADPPREGDERAAAMRRLKEPINNKGTPEDQDAILDILAKAATSDPSPVLRMEAIGALGRFQDPRAVSILMTAYQNAHGRRPSEPAPQKSALPAESSVIQASGLSAGRAPTRSLGTDRFPLTGPTGYPPEWVTAIRCRAAESLGQTSRPEAAKFLATIAGGAGTDVAAEGSEDRDVRLAAVRGLGRCRQPEAVFALAQVLSTEAPNHDTAMIGRTHEGLVRLTGKKLPPDPQQWNDVVQAGVIVAPEPGWWQNTIDHAVFWVKQQ